MNKTKKIILTIVLLAFAGIAVTFFVTGSYKGYEKLISDKTSKTESSTSTISSSNSSNSSTSSQKATSNFVFDADKREFSTNDYKVKITGFSFQANTVVASKSMLMMQYDFTNTSGEEIRPNEIMTDHVEVLSDGNQLEWGDLLVLDENSTNFSTLENNGIRFVEPGNTTHAQIHYSVPKGSTSDFQIVIKNGSKTVGTINLTRGELGQ